MNKLFLAFIFAFVHGCGSVGIAQTTPNTQTYFQNLPTPVNLIKNPDARLNALDVQKTGTVVVTATAATGNSPTYFSIGAISTLGYAEFDLRPVKNDMTSGQCEFKGKYFGTEASKYSARIFNGTTEVIKVVLKNTTSDLASGGPWGEFSVGAPCSANPKVRIYADAVGLSLNVNRLYYDKATNIGTYTPPSDFGAFVSAAGAISLVTPVGSNILPGSATVSDTSLFTMALTGLTSTPKCWASVNSGTSTVTPSAFVSSVTNTSVSVRTGTVPVGANPSLTKAAVDFTLNCLKTGADAPVTVIRPETPRTPNIVRYTSGSGTYTPTPGTKYIIVEMVGGGGGGGGTGSSGSTNGGGGGTTTFGTSLLSVSGGSGGGGTTASYGGAAGSSITVNSPAVTLSTVLGSHGAAGGPSVTITYQPGGSGAASALGGGAGSQFGPGPNGPVNSGSGGAGAGSQSVANYSLGGGGGSGSYAKAMITYPSGSYAYSVGAAGTAGGAGTSGFAGGAGGSGVIIITEYFSSDVNAIIAGSVYTKSPNAVLKQSALIECSATSSVVASIGSWATISNISGNRCNISMSGFTQNPICMAVVNSVETTNSRTVHLNVTSPTAMSIGCVNQLGGATSACTNTQFYLDCSGF